jgi:hypothetical protein
MVIFLCCGARSADFGRENNHGFYRIFSLIIAAWLLIMALLVLLPDLSFFYSNHTIELYVYFMIQCHFSGVSDVLKGWIPYLQAGRHCGKKGANAERCGKVPL